MTRPATNQLERSLAALTIAIEQDKRFRANVLADTRTGEWEQQVHVPMSGDAGNLWSFVDQDITWEYPFLYAPTQRLIPFETPHFTHGIELLNPGVTLVLFTAHVVSWNINDSNWCIGATVRLGVSAPDVGSVGGPIFAVPYSAIAHLSFQGFATYAEGDEFISTGDGGNVDG